MLQEIFIYQLKKVDFIFYNVYNSLIKVLYDKINL